MGECAFKILDATRQLQQWHYQSSISEGSADDMLTTRSIFHRIMFSKLGPLGEYQSIRE